MRDYLIITIPVIAIAFTLIVYIRNKQNDRARHRRARYEEKREELLETLRRKKEDEEKNEHE